MDKSIALHSNITRAAEHRTIITVHIPSVHTAGIWEGGNCVTCTPKPCVQFAPYMYVGLLETVYGKFHNLIPYIYPVYTPYIVETVCTENPIPPNQTPGGVIA